MHFLFDLFKIRTDTKNRKSFLNCSALCDKIHSVGQMTAMRM